MSQPLSCKQASKFDHAQLYEILVEELTDFAVFLMDPDGCIVIWNPGVERIFGYTEEEWLGQAAEIIFTPEDRAHEVLKNEMAKAARDGRSPDVRWHLRRNGERLYVEGTMVALRDESGNLLGFSKMMRDITERKREADELRQQWQTFDTALSHTPDFAYILDGESRVKYASRSLLSLWQKPLAEVLGKNFFDLDYPPELAERLQDQTRQVITTKAPLRDHTPFASSSGEMRDYEYILMPVFGENNQVEAVTGSTRDITNQKRLERALAHSEERLQQIFAQAPVAILAIRGRDFVIELANPSYQALLQGSDLVGRRFADVMPELEEQVWDVFNRVLDTGEPFLANEWYVSYDYDRDAVNEDHWFNVVYNPLREPDGTVSGLVAVLSEVTAQVLARKELERVNRDLEEFAYVASHDLQEPLRMVNIYSQMILRSLDGGNAKLGQYAEFVRDGVARMEALIRDLLTYSRTVHKDERPVGSADLSASLAEALAVLKDGIEASGAAITTPVLPIVRGETQQLSHVFQNLISNALKYRREEVAPRIHISVESHGDQVVTAVRDNGVGFEQKYAEQIFGLFSRLHRDEYAGTGLGLAICHRIIERYGGRIWAEGRPGEGATFFFSLLNVQQS